MPDLKVSYGDTNIFIVFKKDYQIGLTFKMKNTRLKKYHKENTNIFMVFRKEYQIGLAFKNKECRIEEVS